MRKWFTTGLLALGLVFVFGVQASADDTASTCGVGELVSPMGGPSFGQFASGLATTTPMPGKVIVVPFATTCAQR
jgi:hypothetical protein